MMFGQQSIMVYKIRGGLKYVTEYRVGYKKHNYKQLHYNSIQSIFSMHLMASFS